jgi:hypothetical protein
MRNRLTYTVVQDSMFAEGICTISPAQESVGAHSEPTQSGWKIALKIVETDHLPVRLVADDGLLLLG